MTKVDSTGNAIKDGGILMKGLQWGGGHPFTSEIMIGRHSDPDQRQLHLVINYNPKPDASEKDGNWYCVGILVDAVEFQQKVEEVINDLQN